MAITAVVVAVEVMVAVVVAAAAVIATTAAAAAAAAADVAGGRHRSFQSSLLASQWGHYPCLPPPTRAKFGSATAGSQLAAVPAYPAAPTAAGAASGFVLDRASRRRWQRRRTPPTPHPHTQCTVLTSYSKRKGAMPFLSGP